MNNLKGTECVIVEFMTDDSTKGYLKAVTLQLAMNLQLGRTCLPHRWITTGNTRLTRNSIQKRCLCYNAVTMQHELRFANDNNNNDNDDLRIVGRSLAG